jgi:hypothetical protein
MKIISHNFFSPRTPVDFDEVEVATLGSLRGLGVDANDVAIELVPYHVRNDKNATN